MNNRGAINAHWQGVDQLHRIVAALLILALAWTWWLGHPRADRPGWCTGNAACAARATPPAPAKPAASAPTPIAPAAAAHDAIAPAAATLAAAALPVPQVESTAPAPTAVPEPARIFFAVNDAQLPPQAAAALADLAAYLKAVPAARASIVGFHDPSGNAAANDALAKARAQAVSAALQAAGVAGSQLSLDKPEATTGSGAPAEARRVEVSVKP